MKKRTKIIAGIVALSLAVASLLTIISCSSSNSSKKESQAEFNNVFNYSAISGISLLNSYECEALFKGETQKSGAITLLNDASSAISDGEKQQIIDNLALAKGLISGEIIQSKTQKSDRSDYESYYVVSLKDISGETQTYEFYYNSTSKTDGEDLFEGEREERLDGIVIFNSCEYRIVGEKESEDGEEEISFLIKLDSDNYVAIEKETERGEEEYSYTAYKNGREVFETSVEYQTNKNGGLQLVFECEQGGEEYEYSYEFYQRDGQSFVNVKYKREGLSNTNATRATIQILTDSDGNVTYLFIEND